MKLPKDFYEYIDLISYQGNLRSIEIFLEDGVRTATGEFSPAMSIIRINGHKPCVNLGRGSGRPVFIESLLLLRLPDDMTGKIRLKHAQGLIGRDVLCQSNFQLSLIEGIYEMCFDSRRAGFLVKDDAVAVDNETVGSCGWNSIINERDVKSPWYAVWFRDATFV